MQPFEVSSSAQELKDIYPNPDELLRIARNVTYEEKLGIIRQWVSEGIPYGFRKCPMLYEAIREWLAIRIGVHPKEITLIGSGRIGYCLAPPPKFGRPFNSESDLDFSVISDELFNKCTETFQSWHEDYLKGIVSPQNPSEKYFWDRNLEVVTHNIGRGFIDPNKIPLRKKYAIARQIWQSIWLLQEKLKITENVPVVRRVSIRVYKDWWAFVRQLEINFSKTIATY